MLKKIKPIIIIFSILIGIFIIKDNIEMDNTKKIENKKITEFIIKNEQILEEINNDQNEISIDNDYLMILEIPKISLRVGLYPKESNLNDVNKTVKVLKESDLPNNVNGNLILAGHSGSTKNSYFNLLYKLQKDDVIYIYYNKNKYIYTVNNFYEVPKTGNIEVKRNLDKNTITLITCKKYTTDTQLVYIGYLKNTE